MALVLVVAAGGRGQTLQGLLENAGHTVCRATGFRDASEILATRSPDLLASELRLGAFNGLHLVIRFREHHPSLRAIVVNKDYDPVLAREAAACGAIYAAAGIDDPELVGMITEQLPDGQARRWPRKKPADPLVVRLTDGLARVLDLSYGGIRFETAAAANVPSPLTLVFPDSGVAIEAHPVWWQPSPVGSWWCGAEISGLGHSAQEAWRQLVDTVPASA